MPTSANSLLLWGEEGSGQPLGWILCKNSPAQKTMELLAVNSWMTARCCTGAAPSAVMRWPNKWTEARPNWHFSIFRSIPYFTRPLKHRTEVKKFLFQIGADDPKYHPGRQKGNPEHPRLGPRKIGSHCVDQKACGETITHSPKGVITAVLWMSSSWTENW